MKCVAPAAVFASLVFGTVAAHAASWTIDTSKSHLGFTGKENGTPFSGAFGAFSGTINFDPAEPAAGHGAVTIKTVSAHTGDPQKDGALPDEDWFAVGRYPVAQLAITSFKSRGPGAYEAEGSLTIRGVTRPIALPFTLAISGHQAKANGSVQLIRTNYGVGQGAWSTAQFVALEVDVSFDIVAETSGQ